MTTNETLERTVKHLRQTVRGFTPNLAIILGSGLGVIAQKLNNAKTIAYANIPDFPQTSVKGHKGQLVFGRLADKNVIVLQGRFHYYEGHSMSALTYPIRVLHQLGVKKIIITNAGGGVNKAFATGSIVLINDHINHTYQSTH